MTQQILDVNEVTAQVRQRGQITVPAALRERYNRLRQKKYVKITPINNGLVVRPLVNEDEDREKRLDKAKKVWKRLGEGRKYDRNPNVIMSEFVVRDRELH